MQAVAEQQTTASTNGRDYYLIASEYISSLVGDTYIVSREGQLSPLGWWSLVSAPSEDILPISDDGHVLAEYAKKQANRYLQERLTIVLQRCGSRFGTGRIDAKYQ